MTLEIGTHRAKAVHGNAALGFTKNGKEQVAVLLRFIGGPNDGQHVTWYGYFTEKTEERTLESLRYMGWTGDDISDLSTVGDSDAPEVDVVLEDEQDEDTGETRVRVRWINRIAGLAMKERMNEAQAKMFAARIKGRVLAMNKKSGQPKNTGSPNAGRVPPSRRDDPPPHDDQDAPF